MRLNKYLSGAAILSLISSCTYYIPLDNVNEPSKLVLYSLSGKRRKHSCPALAQPPGRKQKYSGILSRKS